MKNKPVTRDIQSIDFHPDIKNIGFARFQKVIDGYVSAGKRDKPTSADVRALWKKLTGEVITSKD